MSRKHRYTQITALILASIIIAGCGGKSSTQTASKVQNQTSSVEDVLAEGIEDSSAQSVQETTQPDPQDLSQEASSNSSSADASLITPITGEDELVYEKEADPSVDIDLTALSATMVYSEVFQMMYYPENYVGKTVKMNGLYDIYTDENSGKTYHACIIQDATACCAQGIEFNLTDEAYPEADVLNVEVKGTFTLYEEDGVNYCTLSNAELLSAS